LLTGSTPHRTSAYTDLDADQVTALGEPGWARTVYALPVTVIDGEHTLLRAVMRAAATDGR
jgi:hypothetical protein